LQIYVKLHLNCSLLDSKYLLEVQRVVWVLFMFGLRNLLTERH